MTSFHLMVHYANDYFDRECDAARQRTAWSGGSGVLVAGGIHPRRRTGRRADLRRGGHASRCARFALAGNAVVAWLGIAILVLAWCYSAPPVRLAARGLGELDTALVVAVLVPFAGYAAFAGGIGEPILLRRARPGRRDVRDDAGRRAARRRRATMRAGKRTWSSAGVRHGRGRSSSAVTLASFATVIALGLRLHAGLAMLALGAGGSVAGSRSRGAWARPAAGVDRAARRRDLRGDRHRPRRALRAPRRSLTALARDRRRCARRASGAQWSGRGPSEADGPTIKRQGEPTRMLASIRRPTFEDLNLSTGKRARL